MTGVTGESVLPVEDFSSLKPPTGITESRVTSVTEQFLAGTRVRLVCAREWTGEVIGNSGPDGNVKVRWLVGMEHAIGTHSPVRGIPSRCYCQRSDF